MPVTEHQLNQFNAFARGVIAERGDELTLDELWDEWRMVNPLPEESRRDLLAVKAAIRDMTNGDCGVPANDYVEELRKRYNLAADA